MPTAALDPNLVYTVAATFAGGMLSMLAAAAVSFVVLGRVLNRLSAFPAGVLLATACLHLIPEAFESEFDAHEIGAIFLGGLVLFFIIHRWVHAHAAGGMVLVADAVHNFADGLMIATAFSADTRLGIVATLSVIVHELPQEISEFMVLMQAGWTRRRALLANALVSLTAVLGGIVGWLLLDSATRLTPVALILAAASFLYISLTELLPRTLEDRDTPPWLQALLLLGGVALIAWMSSGAHHH